MGMEIITSTSNAQIRRVATLLGKTAARREADLFVVEGPKMFSEAPRERIAQVFVSESFYWEAGRAKELEGLRVSVVADPVFTRMSDTRTPQGVLCLVRCFHYREEDLIGAGAGNAPFVLVLENLQDPGNLGTILRTGEGAGVTGVLLGPGCVDVYNPKVIRSTMGSVYRVPFAVTEDLAGSIRALQRRGIRVYAAHLGGRMDYDEPDYTKGSAFLIGNESKGLTDETAALADTPVRIPMLGQVESLNAAMACGILSYEAAGQRRRRST